MKSKILFFAIVFLTGLLTAGDIKTNDRVITLECSGISFIGSGITVDDAKKFAVNDAKRNALEQVGTYLESTMKVKDHMVTKDDIQTYTAGILKTEILSSENKVIEGTFAIEVFIKAKIDKEYLEKRLNRIQGDLQLRKMLEEQKKLNDKLTREINELKAKKKGYKKKSKNIALSLEANDWFDMGYESQENGKYRNAIKHYNKAIRFDPNIAQIYNNRGLAYYFLKDYDNAEANFNKAIHLKPDLAMAYNNKAIISYEKKKYKNAVLYFNKVIDIDPELEQIYYNRGFAYLKLEKKELCVKDLKKYLEIAGNKNGDLKRIQDFIDKLEEEIRTSKVKPKPEVKYSTVPDLFNLPLTTAEKRLKDAGLKLGIIKKVTDIDKGFDRIISQSVKGGKKVKEGSVVDVTLNVEVDPNIW